MSMIAGILIGSRVAGLETRPDLWVGITLIFDTLPGLAFSQMRLPDNPSPHCG